MLHVRVPGQTGAQVSVRHSPPVLRLNLFTYRELRVLFQHPYHTPPLMPEQVQLPLLS
ncbi:hypothetical protein DFAR_2200005 [Desulfarculales bacterium]